MLYEANMSSVVANPSNVGQTKAKHRKANYMSVYGINSFNIIICNYNP